MLQEWTTYNACAKLVGLFRLDFCFPGSFIDLLCLLGMNIAEQEILVEKRYRLEGAHGRHVAFEKTDARANLAEDQPHSTAVIAPDRTFPDAQNNSCSRCQK